MSDQRRDPCHVGINVLTVEHRGFRSVLRGLEAQLQGGPALRDFQGRTQLLAKTFVWSRFGTLRGGAGGLASDGGHGFGDLLRNRALRR